MYEIRNEIRNETIHIPDGMIWVVYSYTLLAILFAVIAILGNSLVLYAAYGTKNLLQVNALRDLDIVIKSLAITDLMVGLVGIPCRITANLITDYSSPDFDESLILGKYIISKYILKVDLLSIITL